MSRAAFERAARRYERLLERVEGAKARIALLRFGAFVVAALFCSAALYDRELLWLPIGLAGAGVFVWAVLAHRRPYRLAPLVETMAKQCREHIARLDQNWSGLPDTGAAFLDPERPELRELGVFGRASAWQLISRATLPRGRARLAELLREGAVVESIPARQAAAAELASLSLLRHRLQCEGRQVEVDEAALERFLAWAEAPHEQGFVKPLAMLRRILVPITWLQILLAASTDLVTFWQLGVGLQFILFGITTGRLSRGYLHLLGRGPQKPLLSLRRMFALLEDRRFDAPLLESLREGLRGTGEAPSTRLSRLERVIEALSVRDSALMHAALNVALLWELGQCAKLEAWRAEYGAHVRADLERLADLEALASLAGYAADQPDFCWPTVRAEGPVFDGEGLGYPLFGGGRRDNDFRVDSGGHLVLVTGSNMSGKSSFLRTVGLAVHMAQAGAPVCARRLALHPCRVHTSIQVTDSPEQGLSRFYAEVQRLRRILDAVEGAEGSGRAQLYLIDEMLSGTNSRERHLASRDIVRRLVEAKRSYGLVTTHDLELVGVTDQLPEALTLCHFADRFDGEALHFDYELRPGMAQTTNALHVLALAGIKIRT